jgi:hypothetical protein
MCNMRGGRCICSVVVSVGAALSYSMDTVASP